MRSAPNHWWFVVFIVGLLRLFKKAASLLEVSLGADHPEAVEARARHALILANFLGRRLEAKASLEKELIAADAALGDNLPPFDNKNQPS